MNFFKFLNFPLKSIEISVGLRFQLASVTINFTDNHDYRAVLYSMITTRVPPAPREREKSHRLRHGAWQKPPCFGRGRVLRTREAAPASLPSEFFPHRTLTATAWPTSPLSLLSCLLCPHPGGTAMEVVFSHGHPPPQSAGRV